MFFDNLQNECERQGLKITPVVIECGGSKGSIAAWKKGVFPNSEIVVALSVRLNVSCDFLLKGELDDISNYVLTTAEEYIIHRYRNMDTRDQEDVLDYITLRSSKPLNRKKASSSSPGGDNIDDETAS